MVGENIAFGVIAAVVAWSAIRVVTTNNVIHAALWLIGVLAGAAALYALLAAEFLAVTQVLVYIGAVVVLLLFGTMLTRARVGKEKDLDLPNRWVGGLVAVVLAGVLAYVLIDAFGAQQLPEGRQPTPTAEVSDLIFGPYLIPFEVLSLLLLAALMGAVVLARRD